MKTLAIFAVFLAFGAFSASAQSNTTSQTTVAEVKSIDLPTPEQSAKSTLKKLQVKLNLTDAQVAELKPVMESKPAVFQAKLKQVLTPAQAAKMEETSKVVSKDLE